ncbi:MAG: hypothetical protein SGCHY_003803 [Lobulomycetales sp.]
MEPILGMLSGKSWITVTWAQSINGVIGSDDQRLLLSGDESLRLTHCIRERSDSILIGINTLLKDQPRLDVVQPDGSRLPGPVPVIIDSKLQTPPDARILSIHSRVIIFTSIHVPQNHERARQLESKGAKIHRIPVLENTGHLDLQAAVKILRETEELTRLMVEGGAKIIESFLPLADTAIVTISPQFISKGVKIETDFAMKDPVCTAMLGRDIIIAARVK